MDENYCIATLKWEIILKRTNNEWSRLPTVKRLFTIANFIYLIDRERRLLEVKEASRRYSSI